MTDDERESARHHARRGYDPERGAFVEALGRAFTARDFEELLALLGPEVPGEHPRATVQRQCFRALLARAQGARGGSGTPPVDVATA